GRLDRRLIKLFDPEVVGRKIGRIKEAVQKHSIDLLTGGLASSSLARELELPPKMVEVAFEEIARTDPELRVTRQAGEALLYRGVAAIGPKEDDSMSLAEWVRSLFSHE